MDSPPSRGALSAQRAGKHVFATARLRWTAALFLYCAFVLFFSLGDTALFEPDEGRNAEVAREILVLDDWVTPHYNFIPRLDKPIFFYWMVAASYKLFGISEWSARFPSAVSALGVLAVVFLFSLRFSGSAAAFWSTLILLTNVAFFALSRIVIFDMMLTFFVTLSLSCFYWAKVAENGAERRAAFLLFYASLGAATLVKGAVGLVLPGMIIFFYLLLARDGPLLRRMLLPSGIALFLAVVVPWYALAEIRNPGYLRYFLVEEHLLRFSTGGFNRSQPWHYFIPVLAVGFFPWTVLLPAIVREGRVRSAQDERLLLLLWAVVPFIFFSLSVSKLAQYILPIFPPLAMLAGRWIARAAEEQRERKWVLSLPALALLVLVTACIASVLYPYVLPDKAQEIVQAAFPRLPALLFVTLALAVVSLVRLVRQRLHVNEGSLCFMIAGAFGLISLLGQPVAVTTSQIRSSKELAEKSAAVIPAGSRVAIYEAYLPSLPFYLRADQAAWVIWSETKHRVMGSSYVAAKRPEPAAGYGQVLLSHEEFEAVWRNSDRPVLVFVEEKNLGRFAEENPKAHKILQVGEVALITNRRIPRTGESDSPG